MALTTTNPEVDALAAKVMADGFFNWQKDGRLIHKILLLLLPVAGRTPKAQTAYLVKSLIALDKKFDWKMADKTQAQEDATYRQFVGLWMEHPDMRAELEKPAPVADPKIAPAPAAKV